MISFIEYIVFKYFSIRMRTSSKQENRQGNFIISLIVVLCIFATSSVTGVIFNITNIVILICLIGTLFAFLNSTTSYNTVRYMFLALGLLFITVVQFIIYPDNVLRWLRLVYLFLTLTQITIFIVNNNLNLVKIFYRVFMIMALISTSLYVVIELLHFPLPYRTVSTEWLPTYNSYFYLYNSIVRETTYTPSYFGLSVARNFGFFTEPGLYALFLILCLYILLFLKNKKSKAEWALIIFSILTTFSTTGYILAVVILGYYLSKRSKAKRGSSLSVPVVATVLIGGGLLIYNILQEKQSEHEFSYMARSFDLIGGFKLFLQHPILGVGYDNHQSFIEFSANVFEMERNDSNGVVSILYQLGLVGAAIYYIPMIKAYKKLRLLGARKSLLHLFIVTLIVLIMSEPIQYSPGGIMIFCYMYAICMSKKKFTVQQLYF